RGGRARLHGHAHLPAHLREPAPVDGAHPARLAGAGLRPAQPRGAGAGGGDPRYLASKEDAAPGGSGVSAPRPGGRSPTHAPTKGTRLSSHSRPSVPPTVTVASRSRLAAGPGDSPRTRLPASVSGTTWAR